MIVGGSYIAERPGSHIATCCWQSHHKTNAQIPTWLLSPKTHLPEALAALSALAPTLGNQNIECLQLDATV